MFRAQENHLKQYFTQKNYKPLVLRGARQVGKSTLVTKFCSIEKYTLVSINLEIKKYKTLEQEDIDLSQFIQEIEVNNNQSLDNPRVILFIDEIQSQPRAIKYLRYFYEQRPEIKVIAAGSLLDFYLSDEKLSIPVGRINYFYIGPMLFSEFLIALKEEKLAEAIKNPMNLSNFQMDKLKSYYRQYLFVGGMPEAVKTYIETKSLLKVTQVHKSLLQTYKDDFIKYTKNSQMARLHKVYDFLPLKIGQKIKYSEIDSEEKSQNIKQCIDLLAMSKIVSLIYHTKASLPPVAAYRDEDIFKTYFLDVGLVVAAKNIKWEHFFDDNSKKLDEGFIHEQFIAQHLLYREQGLDNPTLCYWLRDRSTSKAEVDFVIDYNNQMLPIEVKTVVGKMKSLFVYLHEKKIKNAVMFGAVKPAYTIEKFKVKTKDSVVSVTFNLIQLPHFCVEYYKNM